MKTYSAKPGEVEQKWILIDGEGLVVGRLASIIATRLRGKHKPTFTPHVEMGDNVIVINADKVVFTGKKYDDKRYYRHTGYPGGIKETSPKMIMEGKFPERVVMKAVERMLNKSKLRSRLLRNLRIYKGDEHPHSAQSPEVLDVKIHEFQEYEGLSSMAEEIKSLEDLGDAATAEGVIAENAAPVHVQKLDLHGRAYATGKRKDAIARVWLKPGSGRIQINNREYEQYFARPVLQMLLKQPLQLVERLDQYDIMATVKGGGLSGQAGAVRHGISKALTHYEPDLRPALKKGGFLTRDSRTVERKKYGRKKARRSFQFSKR